MKRYQTRSRGHPPQKKARVVDSEPIDLTEQSLDSSPEPSPDPSTELSPALSSENPVEPQPSQPPFAKSQIPSGIAPEVLIRHPMVAQPPIKGNLDYQARPFHSELCFDTTTFRFQPELADSFHQLLSTSPLPLQCPTQRPQSLMPLLIRILKMQRHLPEPSAYHHHPPYF